MFKQVLLCYDGSRVGRGALKQGTELAMLVGAAGQPCLVNIDEQIVAHAKRLSADLIGVDSDKPLK